MYIGAVLTVISFVVGLTQIGEIEDALREQLREDQPELTDDEFETALDIGIAAGYAAMGINLVFAGVWVWMGVMNSRGRSWARITAAILGGLNIAFTLLGVIMGASIEQNVDIEESPLSTMLGIGSAGLAAIILILLFQAASSAYYNAVTQWRATPRWG